MAYRIEQDGSIIIDGFENGIAPSPYAGISDMRNIEIINIPGEGSVAFSTSKMTTQVALSAQTFTASNSGGDLILTWAGSTALSNNTAITVTNSGGALPTGLVANRAYYVVSTGATTFKLAASATGTPITYTDAGTGTQTFTTINMAKPKFIIPENYIDTSSGVNSTAYHYYTLDANGRAWVWYTTSSQWIYMNNGNGSETTGGAGTLGSGNGIVSWGGANNYKYLFVMSKGNVNYINTFNGTARGISYLTTYSSWAYSWQALNGGAWSNDISHYSIVAQDSKVYFCDTNYVGYLTQNAGSTFDPTNAATYTFANNQLILPSFETAICLAELGNNLLVGGVRNLIYPWDKTSVSYGSLIRIAENGISRIVTVNTNSYIFAGQRGRIFVTNGSQAQLFSKVPDHLSGVTTPYYTWGDAQFTRNQIFFGVSATNNAGTAINQYGGVWAIDLDSKAIRLQNELSYGTYAGLASAICPLLGSNTSDGYGMYTGWTSDGTDANGGIDSGSANPYTGGQAYIDSDLIPIGTYLNPTTTEVGIEWKLSEPLVSGESIALYYRQSFSDSYTLIPDTDNLGSTVGNFSGRLQANFQKSQWLQIRAILTSTATNPSFVRLREIRIK